jgi:hypothetical protein
VLVREGLARLGYVPFELLGEIGGHELIKGVEIPPTDRSGDPMRDGLVLFRRHTTSPTLVVRYRNVMCRKYHTS